MKMEDPYTDLLLELECPICSNYMSPPIRQCSMGHSICNPCRKQVASCPTCRQSFIETKNITLEALVRKIRLPCIHQVHGCKEKLTVESREDHQGTCKFKNGTSSSSHCISRKYQLEIFTDQSISSEICMDAERQFVFKCKSERSGQVYLTVQFIGPQEYANDYIYEIEIYKEFAAKRFVLRNYCQSIHVEDDGLFCRKYCFLVHCSWLAEFVGVNGVVNYYVHVRKSVGDACGGLEVPDGCKSEQGGLKCPMCSDGFYDMKALHAHIEVCVK